MTFYAVRHIKTGRLMPRLRGRGATNWEPTLTEKEEKDIVARGQDRMPPRLFTRRVDAYNAIDWWAQGGWVNDSEEGSPIPERATSWAKKFADKRPARSKKDLEIIKVDVLEVISETPLLLANPYGGKTQ